MTYHFHEETLAILLKNGWYQYREIDISDYLEYFEVTQQKVSAITLEFLKSFGDITISTATSHPNIINKTMISPIIGSDSMGRRGLEYYQKWTKRTLCIIGLSSNQTLLMTPDGAIYSVFDNHVFLRGKTVVEAIHNICSRKSIKRIMKPDKL